jgi:hypothetical protein
MSGAMREKDSSDYDLERLTELFDEALTSNDPRVKNALRQLMMMVVLTSADHEDRDKQRLTNRVGPMRRMQEDINDLRRSLEILRHEMQTVQKQAAWSNINGMKAQSGPDAVSAKDHWQQHGFADAQISVDDLHDLNIAIAPATKGLY